MEVVLSPYSYTTTLSACIFFILFPFNKGNHLNNISLLKDVIILIHVQSEIATFPF